MSPEQRNVLVFVGAAAAVAGGGWWLWNRAGPPERVVLYVSNGSAKEARLGERPIPPRDWRRFDLPCRKGESVEIAITGAGDPVRCNLREGIHVVSTEGAVEVEPVQYVAKGGIGLGGSRKKIVGRECHQISSDTRDVIYDFDEKPPEKITVEEAKGLEGLPHLRYKLHR